MEKFTNWLSVREAIIPEPNEKTYDTKTAHSTKSWDMKNARHMANLKKRYTTEKEQGKTKLGFGMWYRNLPEKEK